MYHLARQLGPKWVAYRIQRWLLHRAGYSRWRLPAKPWEEFPLERLVSRSLTRKDENWTRPQQRTPQFFFRSQDLPQIRAAVQRCQPDENWPHDLMNRIQSGQFVCFGAEEFDTGWPPRWHQHVVEQTTLPKHVHFSQIGDFSTGDIKYVWELSRFSFAYGLVRAFARTGDSRCVELFWVAFEDWYRENPPNTGVNWKCGQEVAIRLMAWCFAYYGLADNPVSHAHRRQQLLQAIGVSAWRIQRDIRYALSQKNNHGISEAAGLLTTGILFPEFHEAQRWYETGRHHLEALADELILDDGGFSQYSANYHRLMLQEYLWVIQLSKLNGCPLSDRLVQKVEKAFQFLLAVSDSESGGAARYGADDGSIVIPLNDCRYWDFRPVLQSAHWLFHQQRIYPRGPWDEDLVWLFGPESIDSPVVPSEQKDMIAADGGVHTLRGQTGFAAIRCGDFKFRPSDADLLHVDLWWRGINVLIDPGTYSYNSRGAWSSHPLRSTRYHNTVSVNRQDQGELVGRFLVLPWPSSRMIHHQRSADGELAGVEMEWCGQLAKHDHARHRRVVLQIKDENWLFIDNIQTSNASDMELHWLAQDTNHDWNRDKGAVTLEYAPGTIHLQIQTVGEPPAIRLVRADKQSPRGWFSPTYGKRAAALSISAHRNTERETFVTWVSPHSAQIACSQDECRVSWHQMNLQVQWNLDGHTARVLRSVKLSGQSESALEFNSH